jgi:hypothetical protein
VEDEEKNAQIKDRREPMREIYSYEIHDRLYIVSEGGLREMVRDGFIYDMTPIY